MGGKRRNPGRDDPGHVQKLSTGVYGLNEIFGGGLNVNSTTVVIGASGAGKTTLATQFLRRGLEHGEDGIYITLDEAPDQLLKEAIAMGWEDAEDYLEKGSFVFVDAGGKQFTDFIKKELADFVAEWEGHTARIVIDPLTPVLWSVPTKYEQREIVSFLLRETRKIGTVLCTLEEHGNAGDLSTPEIAIPMYLADNVIHLRYSSRDNPERRELKIVKSRMSPHSPFSHHYSIIQGVGVVVDMIEADRGGKRVDVDVRAEFKKMISEVPKERMEMLLPGERKNLYRTIRFMASREWRDVNPRDVLEQIFREYGLK
ncbi:MAG: hypothetical protein J7L61_03890 [Thermoplasmata archaeon]|nr:hypothetical protein [Thermoplasmata archaeon]